MAFFAYALFTNAKTYLIIKPDALEIVKPQRIERFDWDEICEFAKGEGIDRYKVRFKLASDSPPLTINLGFIGIECKNIRYLPCTFGMKAIDLAELLNKIKRDVAEKKQLA